MSNDYIACLERPWREPKNIPVGWQRIQDAPRNGDLIWLWDGMRLERPVIGWYDNREESGRFPWRFLDRDREINGFSESYPLCFWRPVEVPPNAE